MGIRIASYKLARQRFLYTTWFPIVLDFGVIRYNRYWWHNLHCRFAIVYRIHYGKWPLYHEWKRGSK